jgi:hypothetical protein
MEKGRAEEESRRRTGEINLYYLKRIKVFRIPPPECSVKIFVKPSNSHRQHMGPPNSLLLKKNKGVPYSTSRMFRQNFRQAIELTPPTHGPSYNNLKKRIVFRGHRYGDILFAVAEFLGTGSQVPLLLVIDAI